MNTIATLDCRACGKRARLEWTKCGGFVRYHRHLDGECQKWAGLRPESPLLCTNCGSSRLQPGQINGRVSETECRDRCLTATGDDCECECGGENHGRYAHGKD